MCLLCKHKDLIAIPQRARKIELYKKIHYEQIPPEKWYNTINTLAEDANKCITTKQTIKYELRQYIGEVIIKEQLDVKEQHAEGEIRYKMHKDGTYTLLED